MGHDQRHGGAWSGDLWIADWEQFENAESVNDISVKRFKSQEIFPVKLKGQFRYPVATGDLRQPEFGKKQIYSTRRKKKKRPHSAGQPGAKGEDEDDDEDPAAEAQGPPPPDADASQGAFA